MSPTFAPISAGGVGKATVNGTTGSPTVNTNARPGKTIYEFNGSGSITIGTAGYAEIAVIGGGGSGLAQTFGFYSSSISLAPGGGGGGGVYQDTEYFFNSGSKSITVGSGGANAGTYLFNQSTGGSIFAGYSYPGNASAIGNILVPGGGVAISGNNWGVSYDAFGGYATWKVVSGGGYHNAIGSRPYTIGNGLFLGAGALGGIQNGGTGRGAGGGGGGPSAGGGGGASNNSTGNGGSGTTVNITGSSVVYGGGGGGGNDGTGGSGGGAAGSTSAGANTGGGGGGGGDSRNGSTNAGGSGKVIVVIG